MDKSVIISPSILTADFANLRKDIEMVNDSKADWFHLDVMDGVFVPNISFGFPVIMELAKWAKKPLDVHLMIVEPLKFLKEVKNTGAYIMNVHYEACPHLHRNIQQIKNEGMKAGVTLNPHTPVSVLEEIIPDLDLVLLMSVNPGFGGQKFIENTLDKTKRMKEMILRRNSHALIQIDGGVNEKTGKLLVEAGADSLVAGSYVFQAPDPFVAVETLKNLK
ncbi:MAG TPA: ribulose-phosphate 3-epimerase [Porphyromonadaceae bacterium]|nr:ribulose-phosphate 3-epimerase [Porphyromonadaceae bacterium]